MAEERARHPGAAVGVWAFDEHRAGLKPVIRRAWAKRGRRPVAVAEPRYQWLHPYGSVRPTTGTLVWFPCDAVNAALLSAVPARFAAEIGAGSHERVIPVLETAPAGTRAPASPCPRASAWSSCRPVFARAATGRAPVAADQRGGRQPTLRRPC